MDRYLVETPHDEKGCIMLLDEVSAMGFLHHFEWGCEDGVHSGWAIIEAESEEEAMLVVPLIARDSARAVRLIKFSPEAVKELHSE